MIMGIIGSVCVVLILAFQFTNIDTQNIGKVNVANKENKANPRSIIDWKDIDLHARDIGNHEFTGTISDNTKILQLEGGKTDVELFYKECIPKETAKGVLWLLHGAAFTSNTWQNSIPTIQTICELGYRVVAIDIPGYGKSPSCNGCNHVEFMKSVLDNIIGDSAKPVIVSPSMSGGWSLPFIKEYQGSIRGFVPVAPVQTSNYAEFFSNEMQIPTMIVYGEKDTGLGTQSYKYLKTIKTSTKPQVLKEANHPAYLDQPEEWHTLLYNFLNILQ